MGTTNFTYLTWIFVFMLNNIFVSGRVSQVYIQYIFHLIHHCPVNLVFHIFSSNNQILTELDQELEQKLRLEATEEPDESVVTILAKKKKKKKKGGKKKKKKKKKKS